MNLLLVEPAELRGGVVRLGGRRARHLREVLRAAPGERVRVGVVEGGTGYGVVEHSDDQEVVLRCTIDAPGAPRPEDTLLLAVPRPKVLRRCLIDAAALGFGRVLLFRSWRVDKSHLGSHALAPETLREALVLGCEQGARTRLPQLEVFPLFRPFVEDQVDRLLPGGLRCVLHPGAGPRLQGLRGARPPFHVAIGPEGGLLPFEVDLFAARGFLPLSMGPHPLRVEAAIASAHGQLSLLTGASGVTPS
jgi:RsmE family RNA methyltransferase